jgi:hypothetical protein
LQKFVILLARLAVGPKWKDLQFSQPSSDADSSCDLPFVIPKRTRISYYAAPEMATCAAFIEESRMKFADPAKLDRKSGAVEGSAVTAICAASKEGEFCNELMTLDRRVRQ